MDAATATAGTDETAPLLLATTDLGEPMTVSGKLPSAEIK